LVIKINGINIAKTPSEFSVDVMDLDDGSTTTRTVDGTLHRDRIAVKRKLNMRWNALTWDVLSELLESVSPVFFEVYYPDPMTGQYETKTFYVGDRQAPVAIVRNGTVIWEGLTMNFIER
jgi:hypothetical protein